MGDERIFPPHADPSRLVHYEGIFWNREYPATSDMESQMYTPVADIKKFLAEHPEKPFIMCEYSHAMGNSNGGITDYTEYAYEEPLYQGGFIWEYMDHGIAVMSPDGKPGFAYGGDFGDRPTDREFCVDGLVLPDRRNTPKMDAVKAAYAPAEDHPDRHRSRDREPEPLYRPERLRPCVCVFGQRQTGTPRGAAGRLRTR